ncbi:alcohol dehydrogenase protein [Pochonia chlamydosporia 170]|uniref:Alcohol dehydrogenase protein n=1 Tax=Pochonia chlamydosporia 170 TaxID=1380566 RepID=A0A179FQ34_METCM|nr:alcohol dehydrogenase protein [Pochonia chlamydosporia 170]OAQ67735.1 alcohol dehydrogenase protein [Pochonia chlamydosporia 170]
MSVVSQPYPQAGAGSAIIQVLAAGVLTYAGRVYSGQKPYPYPTPFVPGLSAIGRISEVGPDATSLTPGQLVYFDCFIQGRDDPNSLILHGLSAGFSPASNKLMEGEWRDSTYAEYAKVPLENCFTMNEAVLMGGPGDGLGYTAVDLMYLAQISVPLGGLRDVGVTAGEKVIIAPAAGTFGSAAVIAALAMGAQVIAVGRNVDTLNMLKRVPHYGERIRTVCVTGDIDTDIRDITKHGLADVFFDISPGQAISSTHFKSGLMSLRRGGRVSLMGAHAELSLPTQFIMLNDITVKGKWMYTKDDIRKMISLAESGYIKLGDVGGIETVGAFRLEEFEEAFDTAANMRGPYLQTVITP